MLVVRKPLELLEAKNSQVKNLVIELNLKNKFKNHKMKYRANRLELSMMMPSGRTSTGKTLLKQVIVLIMKMMLCHRSKKVRPLTKI